MNYKHLLFNLLLLFLPVLLMAQYPSVYIVGVVTNTGSGQPVSGASVYVSMDSVNMFPGYSNVVTTDINGNFTDTIWVNTYVPQANVVVSTSNCNGAMVSQTFAYSPNSTNNFACTFSVNCGGGGGFACAASFSYQISGNTVSFTNNSIGSAPMVPINSTWTFSNGSTSNLSNPTVTFANPGSYTACLVITDTTGCTDSTCQTFTISGGGGGNCSSLFTWAASGLTVQFDGSMSVGTSYVWTFVNSTSALQSPSFTFPAAGTYTVCLTVSDTSGCSNTSCQQVIVGGGVNYNTIDVTVTAVPGGVFAADTFMVWLIQYDSLAGTLTAIDSAIAMQGPNGGLAGCSFINLNSGDYLVKAAVSTVNSPNYATSVPTYYTNGLFWSVATSVSVPSGSPISLMINMIQGVNPGGPGFIGGLVSQGANKTGIPNVEIILLDMSDNPITYTYSNATGSFTFPNLAYGTYKVYAEVLGKPTTPAIVTISATTPMIGDVDVQINSTYVSTAIHQAVYFDNSVKLYPNPATNVIYVEVDLKHNTNIEVEVSNIFGQLVQKIEDKFTSGNHTITLDTNNWNSGVYFVKVIANGTESEVQKLIVE